MTDAALPLAALAALLAAYVFSIFFRGFLTIIAADLNRDLGIGPAELGALGASWFLVFAVAQFPVGYALDRYGPRLTVSACMVAGTAGIALLAAATTRGAAMAGMGLIGLGCAPIFMAALFILAKKLPPERFGPVSSVFIGLGSAGNLLAATPMALAVEAYGWRITLWAVCAAFAMAGLAAALLVRDPPRAPASQTRTDGALAGLARVARLRALWPMLPMILISYAILVTERGLWIGPFLEQTHGFGKIQQGHAAFLMAVAMTGGALAFGAFEQRLGGPKRAVVLGTGVVIAAYGALALVGAGSALAALALLTLIGAASLTYGPLMAHARLFLPEALLGRGMTLVNFVIIAGAALVQYASGAFMQVARDAGAAPASAYGALHAGFAVLLVLALAAYAFAPARPR